MLGGIKFQFLKKTQLLTNLLKSPNRHKTARTQVGSQVKSLVVCLNFLTKTRLKTKKVINITRRCAVATALESNFFLLQNCKITARYLRLRLRARKLRKRSKRLWIKRNKNKIFRNTDQNAFWLFNDTFHYLKSINLASSTRDKFKQSFFFFTKFKKNPTRWCLCTVYKCLSSNYNENTCESLFFFKTCFLYYEFYI